MKPTIEIKLGRERHRLVPCEGNGCAACSLYTMCYVMKACGRQLCDAAYLETTEWKDNQNHRFELLTK